MSDTAIDQSSASCAIVGSSKRRHTPGEAGLWVFILGDLSMFAFFFGQFIFARGSQHKLFDHSRAELSLFFGTFNTCLLLTGSLFVVWMVQAIRRGERVAARRFLAAGFGTGFWFLVNKAFEWGHEISRGLTPISNDFFTYFFAFTGIHALHVTIGLCVLAYLWRLAARSDFGERDLHTFESGAVYWHLVDLLWIVLFALLYLMA
jgi:nitric oxide reductase NorE protein